MAQEPQHGRERFRPVPDQIPGAPPDPTILGGVRVKNALPRATLAAGGWFGLMAIFLRVHGLADLFPLGGAALVFGLLFYLFLLTQKSDTFTFDREALKIRGRSRLTGTHIREMSVRWDSVERIRVERDPRHAESRYSIVAWFHPSRVPSSALLRKYGGWLEMFGGRQRQDRAYVVYRSARQHRDGVPFSQLNEIFPKYAGRRYEDLGNPPA